MLTIDKSNNITLTRGDTLTLPELQYLELSSKRDSNRQRTVRKIMNYHAIQL